MTGCQALEIRQCELAYRATDLEKCKQNRALRQDLLERLRDTVDAFQLEGWCAAAGLQGLLFLSSPHKRIGLLTVAMLLHEAQDVEVLDLAFREEAVHSILLFRKNLEDRRQFREHHQLQVAPVQMHQR